MQPKTLQKKYQTHVKTQVLSNPQNYQKVGKKRKNPSVEQSRNLPKKYQERAKTQVLNNPKNYEKVPHTHKNQVLGKPETYQKSTKNT